MQKLQGGFKSAKSQAVQQRSNRMNYEENYKRNSFKPIKENPVILDFTGCKYLCDIHRILKTKFGLPEYYGENRDALWDCLCGLFYQRGNFKVEIYGFTSLPDDLREYCKDMLEIFDDVHKDTQNVTFELIS